MTTYTHVGMNICKENNVYRVRFQKNGKRVSKSFTTKKAAMQFRKAKLGF